MGYPSKAHLVTPRNALPLKYLREILSYSKTTGLFRWKKTLPPRGKKGQVAGYRHRDGRIFICIHGARYGAHRLAWFYVTGKWPKNEIDHRRGLSNRWKNLRHATHAENMRNGKCKKHSKQPLKGVKRHHNKWQARITYNWKSIYLGLFDTAEEAHAAYCAAARKFHKKFARFD
jgi:HNH endonuclease